MGDEAAIQTMEFPPQTASVFRALRMGKHLSRRQGEVYYDLDRHYKQYAAVFGALGYRLIRHEQGFYYFAGDSVLRAQRLRAITLFVLILFQDLEDKKYSQGGRSWERELLTRQFTVAELPHFATAQRRALMHAVGVTPESLDSKLRFMSTLGFIDINSADSFHFLPPIYRFVDLFLIYADDEQWARQLEQPEEDVDELMGDDVDNDSDAEVADE